MITFAAGVAFGIAAVVVAVRERIRLTGDLPAWLKGEK